MYGGLSETAHRHCFCFCFFFMGKGGGGGIVDRTTLQISSFVRDPGARDDGDRLALYYIVPLLSRMAEVTAEKVS